MSHLWYDDRYTFRKCLVILLLAIVVKGTCSWEGHLKLSSDPSNPGYRLRSDIHEEYSLFRNKFTNITLPNEMVLVTNDTDDGERDRRSEVQMETSRLFAGHRRRLKFALMPIMFKLGVISTLLVVIAIMVVKGLTIGIILLFFALGNSFKHKFHDSKQPVHVHLHSSKFHSSKGPVYSYEPSGPWDRAFEDSERSTSYDGYDFESGHRLYPIYHHHPYYRYGG